MSWLTSLPELRELVSDGPTDKLRFRKRVIGAVNGTNKVFKTFEFRRVTDFTTSTFPLGVFVSDSITPATLISDDPISGTFVLSTAPTTADFVEATYYTQYFLDTELVDFLGHATNWLLSTTDVTLMPPGLQPSALKYAASEAYQKLAQRFMDHESAVYRMEDAPDDKKVSMVEKFQAQATYYKKAATEARDEFYTRQGQSLQPLFLSNAGSVKDVPPRR